MRTTLHTTASTLLAVLAYIDPEQTPKIAYDKDELAIPLILKVKEAVGGKDGSQRVSLCFDPDESELRRQFSGICNNISDIMRTAHQMTES